MSFFVTDAWADAAPAAGVQGSLVQLLPLAVIFVLFYFLLIRPQLKRTKDHKKMVDALAKNDEVVTSGGLLGKIVDVDESFFTVEIAEGVRVKVQKSAVSSLLPAGTLKAK